MQNYPVEFLNEMKKMLKDDFFEFEKSLSLAPYRALRVNTLKCTAQELQKYIGFTLNRTPFCSDGYYIPPEINGLGNSFLHHAGTFYIQEPSAMLPAEAADIQEGDKVLDLCAAPGGKSTQAGVKLRSKGLLWSNEPVRGRAVTLMSNIERMGIKNSIVSCAYPDRICSTMPEFFDKIIVDAPCSGEGMFRKDSGAIDEWSREHVQSCAVRQLAILNSAKDALSPGGTLIYSTCTYSFEENEGVIEEFLQQNSDFSLEPINIDAGMSVGTGMIKVLPIHGGEGHFCAKLKKRGEKFHSDSKLRLPALSSTDEKTISDFLTENFIGSPFGKNLYIKNDKIFALPDCNIPDISSAMRAGILLGEIKKGRVEPSHAAYMSLVPCECTRCVDLEANDPRIYNFLRGEEISIPLGIKGYTALAACGMILGYGKASGGILKNKYPKGLRINGQTF